MTATAEEPGVDREAERLAPVAALLERTWSAREVRVVAADRLSGGASRITWSLDVVVDDDRLVPLVLQRQRPGAIGTIRPELEERLLRAAAAGGVPVPGVVAADPAGELLGSPFLLTERVEGETIPRRVLRRPDLAPARARFAADCGRVLAAVHALPLAELPDLPRTDSLQEVVGHLDDALGASPAFELALLWLIDTRPPAVPPVVVHGDFRTGNLLLGPEGLRAVLDWELAHVGDAPDAAVTKPDDPDSAPDLTALNARPTAAELVEAVLEFLDEEVLPGGAAPGAFQVRVAAGALRIVERELTSSEDDRRRHTERLAALGFADDAALAAALRRRQVPIAQLPAVRATVLASVEDALRVANPRHFEAPP